jgi:predicted DsbA family dithiol-disulfide isomerase
MVIDVGAACQITYDSIMKLPATFFADLICPFCYLAASALGRLVASGEVEVRFKPFEIHPETPREGVPLTAFGAAKVDALYRELGWLAGDAGVRLLKPERLPNSRLALEAVEMARAAKGEAAATDFAGRAFTAYFAEGKDIGNEDILRGIATAVGVGREWQDRCFLGRKFGGAVDAAKLEAHDALVTAVPAMNLGGIPALGYQNAQQLKRLVEKARKR